jgi:murein DD-endopeptidase MepM/ murein hydrolase activator NlpD
MIPMPFPNPEESYLGHNGIDYPQPLHTPVRSAEPGIITRSGKFNERSGLMRELTHLIGGVTIAERAYHLVNLSGPAVGQTVPAGAEWAYVGSTGSISTGPHLHHEVWINGILEPPPAYWDHVDRTRYVGDGQTSGEGGTPFPIPTPPPAPKQGENDMGYYFMTDINRPYYWMNQSTGKARVCTRDEIELVRSADRSGIPGNTIHVVGKGWYEKAIAA